jgi:Holliday junction DNA helicase RuvA
LENAMIGRLAGKVIAEEPSGALILDVNGVGYELLAPLGAVGRAEQLGDQRVALFVHTNLRQDALELFGFASLAEREVFRLLIGVQKVGPKIALGLLSALPPEELAHAVQEGDVIRLSRVPGIGKKTAERLVLELKEKMPGGRLPEARPAPTQDGQTERLIGALTNMGYRTAEAERAVESLGDRLTTEPLPSLLRAALAALTSRRS